MPLILMYQVYTMENDEKIAWAEMFCEYAAYEDGDKNAIYSAGETEHGLSVFSLYESDEFEGTITPWALNMG
jgi:hypothetical protein